jgi:hypothetical protein
MDCELREFDWSTHGASNRSFSLERDASAQLDVSASDRCDAPVCVRHRHVGALCSSDAPVAKCTSGDFKTFLVRIIVLANSDNVIGSTYHNR